jgi:hypothetical protein
MCVLLERIFTAYYYVVTQERNLVSALCQHELRQRRQEGRRKEERQGGKEGRVRKDRNNGLL